MKIVTARAPTRIDFAGGWTDVALFSQKTPGYVVNAAIAVHSYVTAQVHDNDGEVSIYSADFDKRIEAASIDDLRYDGDVDLPKASLKRMNPGGGISLIMRSNAPPGAGLGGSSSVGVATLGALAKVRGSKETRRELCEIAGIVEREELGILGGKQDYYAAAMGGFCFMKFEGEEVTFGHMRLSEETVLELQKHLVLCYTGKSRVSGDIHAHVTDAFKRGDPQTLEAMELLKHIAREMNGVLEHGDLRAFGKLMHENWCGQKGLHSSVTNPQIERLFEVAYANGAIGGKACGAGGGGCVVFYCERDREHEVHHAVQRVGARVMDFNFDMEGLKVW